MKNLQDFVFKLARGHPNAPLPPPAETLLREHLHRFVSHNITPEHPPYSAMIHNALQELKEKGGSREESISRYLEKKYDNLPWAHSALLKHHLEKTCESGDIVVTRAKKYRLAESLNLSTKSKSKPQKSREIWECKKRKHDQLKLGFKKKRNQQRGERVEVNKKYQEKSLTESGVHSDDKQDQEKSLQSCLDVEKSSRSNPTILLAEPSGMIAAANGEKFPEEVRSNLENGYSAIAESDLWEAHTQEPQETERSESVTPERPPGFESLRADNFPELGSTEPEPEPVGEVTGSTRVLRRLKSRSRMYSEPRASTITSVESATHSKAGEYDSPQSEHNMETLTNQQQARDLVPVTLKQMHYEQQQHQLIQLDDVEVAQSVTKGTKLTRDGRCCKRRYYEPKENVFEPHMEIDSSTLCLTSNESEFALSTEQELLQQPLSQQNFQGKLRRSLRGHPAKPEVAKDTNTVDVLPPECFLKVRPLAVRRRLGRPLRKRPSNQAHPRPKKAASVDELKDQPESKKKIMLLKKKPNEASVESPKVVDNCREHDFTQSGIEAEFTSMHEKMEPDASKLHLQEVQNKPRLGRPPKSMNKMMEPDTSKLHLQEVKNWPRLGRPPKSMNKMMEPDTSKLHLQEVKNKPRLGRPPKFMHEKMEPDTSKLHLQEVQNKPRNKPRLGRPPKSMNEMMEPDASKLHLQEVQNKPRLGRPPKSMHEKMEPEASKLHLQEVQNKKKRGRPPKSMHEKMEPEASKLHLQEVQNKKRRGRPPKCRSARLLTI